MMSPYVYYFECLREIFRIQFLSSVIRMILLLCYLIIMRSASAREVDSLRIDGLKWKFDGKAESYSSPVIFQDKIYIGSEDHFLYALYLETGKIAWKFKTAGAVNSSPIVFDQRICFGSMDGYYYALDARTGKLVWKFKTGGEHKIGRNGLWGMQPDMFYMEDPFDFFISSPIAHDNGETKTIYFGSSDGNLYALDAANGNLRWKYPTGGAVRTTPLLYEGTIYIGSWDQYVYAIDAQSGNLDWKFKTKSDEENHLLEGIQASISAADGFVFVGSRDGYLYALDAKKGNIAWQYSTWPSWITTTSVDRNGNIFLTSSDSRLLVGLDVATGAEKLRYQTKGYNFSPVLIDQDKLYFGDFTGKLYVLDRITGSCSGFFETDGRKQNKKRLLNSAGILEFQYLLGKRDPSLYATTVEILTLIQQLDPIIGQPIIKDRVLYLNTAHGRLYALTLHNH